MHIPGGAKFLPTMFLKYVDPFQESNDFENTASYYMFLLIQPVHTQKQTLYYHPCS